MSKEELKLKALELALQHHQHNVHNLHKENVSTVIKTASEFFAFLDVSVNI